MWGQGKKAVYKPGSGSSPENELARTLILDYYPPTEWKNKFCYLSHPVCDTFLWQPKQTNIVNFLNQGKFQKSIN